MGDQRYQRHDPGGQINGLFSAYQGRQYTLTASDASLNMPGNLQTPNQIKPKVEQFGHVGDDGTFFGPLRLRGSQRSGSATWAATRCAEPAW
jgi:hypothetical protein